MTPIPMLSHIRARFESEAHAFGCALLASGLTPGKSVCVLMGNVPEWPISDIGTISAGGIGVGLYPTSSAEQCEYIINHSDAEFVLVDTRQQLDKILKIREHLPKVKAVITLDESAARSAPGVLSYQEFLHAGRSTGEEIRSRLRERAEQAQADDIAIMVYTSGTTGPPKGACLSHRYIINSVESLRQTIPVVSSSEAIKKFLLLNRDFQIETGEVTPTMKIKRNVVTERYGELIQSMYVQQ